MALQHTAGSTPGPSSCWTDGGRGRSYEVGRWVVISHPSFLLHVDLTLSCIVVLPAIDERDELDIELTDITVRIKDVGPSIGGQSDDIEGQADGKTDTDDSEAPLLSGRAASVSTGGSDLETRPGGTSVLSDTMRFMLLGLPG